MALFTIGYSGLDAATFVERLRAQAIDVVCDVRSTPYSKFKPDFSRAALKGHLNAGDIKYLFLGRELGARPEDRGCYVDGQARYDRIAATPLFASGLERVGRGAAAHHLALVCAERDPLDCHRAVLVCDRLDHAARAQVRHLHSDGAVETQAALDDRLIALHGLTPAPLLRQAGDWEQARALAYARQADAIGFREKG